MNTDQSMSESKDTLRFYLQEELEAARTRLSFLKGDLRADDFTALEAELNERSETLDSLTDQDDTQLFILRREIGLLKENMEALAVKQSWWSRLPIYARVLLFTVPVVLYLLVLSLLQHFNRGQIYNYSATQTTIATQTMQAIQEASNTQMAAPTLAGAATPAP